MSRHHRNAMRPVRIAVVGHTNTGKTSLLRTLTRDTGFGEVSSRPSTTRHVEGARLLAEGQVVIELFDTPGMEDPIGLLERLDQEQAATDERLDGPARVQRFLHAAAAHGRFEQEAKVLRQLLASDAAFYVVDVRDPVLAKHKDELKILGSCAVPLLPVLNFVNSDEADLSAWREALARLGLHAQVRFDTVAPERDGERRLYEKLTTLLDDHRPALDKLVASREHETQARHAAALRLVAEMLIDVAAMREQAMLHDEAALKQEMARLHARVREREQTCVQALLQLYRFRKDDVDADQLPLTDGCWEEDPFSPDALRRMGVSLGSGAAAGAAAGAGVDLLTGGMSLGVGAAVGALAGGGLQAFRQFGDRLLGRGARTLAVDDAVLRLLALRELHLVRALEARGHAAIEPVSRFAERADTLRAGPLPPPLRQARGHPQWCGQTGGGARETAVTQLAEALSHEALDQF